MVGVQCFGSGARVVQLCRLGSSITWRPAFGGSRDLGTLVWGYRCAWQQQRLLGSCSVAKAVPALLEPQGKIRTERKTYTGSQGMRARMAELLVRRAEACMG